MLDALEGSGRDQVQPTDVGLLNFVVLRVVHALRRQRHPQMARVSWLGSVVWLGSLGDFATDSQSKQAAGEALSEISKAA